MDSEHLCDVFPADTNTPISADHFISSSSSEQYFKIEVESKSYYLMDGVVLDHFTTTNECGFSNIPKQDIELFIHTMLPHFNVPGNAQPLMAAKILACAEHMANVTHKNHKILGMRVAISNTTQLYHYEYLLRRAVNEVNEHEDHLRSMPASKSAVEGLVGLKVEQKEESTVVGRKLCNCAICFEDFSIDSEALRMPCLHLFHKICIINWLKNRNTCPLCRFQMPAGDHQ